MRIQYWRTIILTCMLAAVASPAQETHQKDATAMQAENTACGSAMASTDEDSRTSTTGKLPKAEKKQQNREQQAQGDEDPGSAYTNQVELRS